MIVLNHLNSTQKSTFQIEAAANKAERLSICLWLSSYMHISHLTCTREVS